MAHGHGPVREFGFAGKETAQQDGSGSATSMWDDLGHSKNPCDRTGTFREHPGLTLARVPLLCRGRSKPPVFLLSLAPPRATHLRPCSGGTGWIPTTSQVTPGRNMARSGSDASRAL